MRSSQATRLITVLAAAALAVTCTSGAAMSATGSRLTAARRMQPCDIYAAAHTPCVAAYSTVRSLYAAYRGPLYEVRRASDHRIDRIRPVKPGGVANAAAQRAFCAHTTCAITTIYDQSGHHNNLTIERHDRAAAAATLPVIVGGRRVYGVDVRPGVGYRHPAPSRGVAVGSAPEGMYMVTSARNVNNGCCFDFGNAEAAIHDSGAGHMDALNFSVKCYFGSCHGRGPWVQADLENGLFQSDEGTDALNTGNSSVFVTAMLENNGTTLFALKGGNARKGRLTTWYQGALPSRYSPMQKEGSVVLGTGGDGTHRSSGYFFEGAMTAGYPTNAADNAVQANVVAAGYR